MDVNNMFFTRTTYNMVRLDWLFIMMGLMFASIANWTEINWWLFAAAFWWIDVIGTAPGMYYHGKNKHALAGEDVPKWAIIAYNFCHSFVTVMTITFVWYLYAGWHWEMLAMPMHLAADRCVFGNIFKNFNIKFDPQPVPAFTNFISEFSASQHRRKNYSENKASSFSKAINKVGAHV